MNQLEISQLNKSFSKNRNVLENIDFSLAQGEFLVILGPSGCGKTTLLRIIAGLETADSGKIIIAGKDVTSLEPRLRDVAMVFQSYALYPHMTVFENLAFALKIRRLDRQKIKEKVMAVSHLLGLDRCLDKKPAQLSGGQRQRVALGRAIVRNPALFLFDEPLSNLDAELRARMRLELLAIHRQLAATSLYVTHDQIEAMTLADKIIIIHDGTQIGPAEPRLLYDNPPDIFTARFLGHPPMNLLTGKVDRERRKIVFAGGMEVDCPEKAVRCENVYYGFRPEHCHIGDSGEFAVRICGYENTGREYIIESSDDGGSRIFCFARNKPAIGRLCWVKIEKSAYFDSETGLAIEDKI